ncbi:hypothetical protein C1646_768172 [Rhizophagus diaphanus]|nr:hypothetical protein C1646_768172 [Rhizophagus diaphanus] [Rhizophagus sp. MUCL 43196]
MTLIEKSSEILLGIDEKARRCLENFIKNLSNRKRIDEDYYLELRRERKNGTIFIGGKEKESGKCAVKKIQRKDKEKKRNEDDNNKDINRKLRKIEKTNEKIILIIRNERSFKNTWG